MEKKNVVTKKITKLDYIFDTKDFHLCVVYDEIVSQKSSENLNIKLMTLQTKEIRHSFFDSNIVNSSKHARNEIININKNKTIVSSAQTLITRRKIRFSFNLKNVFSITR